MSRGSKKGQLRPGITTGASAAAAAGAAARFLRNGEKPTTFSVVNPAGKVLAVKIKNLEEVPGGARVVVIKDGGDDPDNTHGLEIVAEVTFFPGVGVDISGGPGVGIVTKPGLQIPVGAPAINPVPTWMICEAVTKELPEGCGAKVRISVPRGEEVGKRTLNPKLGIVGGISILGTTGIVEPMSEESFKRSLAPQIDVAIAHGYTTICLVPGRLGEKWAMEVLGLPEASLVQMSNFVGYMLEACVKAGLKEVILLGHHSKLTKVAAGCFHTHNRVADARLETLTAHAALCGASIDLLEDLMSANTAEEGYELLRDQGLLTVFDKIAQAASNRAEQYVFGDLKVGTVLFTMQGEVITCDINARELGSKLGWKY